MDINRVTGRVTELVNLGMVTSTNTVLDQELTEQSHYGRPQNKDIRASQNKQQKIALKFLGKKMDL